MHPAQTLLSFVALAGLALLPACSPADNTTQAEEATANLPQNTAAGPEAMTAEAGEPAGHATILQLQNGRPTGKSDPVIAIEDAKYSDGFAGKFIVATMRYGGGCKDHEFAAYWDGSWMESNPPGMNIVLSHDAKGDTCKAIVTKMVQINLADVAAKEPRFWAVLASGGVRSSRVEVGVK
jgi:hypothetical protein